LLTFTFLSLLNSGAGLDVFQIPPHRQAADRWWQLYLDTSQDYEQKNETYPIAFYLDFK